MAGGDIGGRICRGNLVTAGVSYGSLGRLTNALADYNRSEEDLARVL